MLLSDFDYVLPPPLIAQRPAEPRHSSRMLLLDRATGEFHDSLFRELPDLLRGDELLVVNNTRVIPARLFGRRVGVRAQKPGKSPRTRREYLSAQIEVLLTRRLDEKEWEALVRPGRKLPLGERILFGDGELEGEVLDRGDFGARRLRFHCVGPLEELLERLGHVPLPPYIAREDDPSDRERYQTIFAHTPGAVAAPTAGLHFTPEIVARLRARGVEIIEITLEVGLGTFQPIRSEEIEGHVMHGETYEVSDAAAQAIESAKRDSRPIVAVGTTVVRALEDAARKAVAFDASRSGAESATGRVEAGRASANLFLYPGQPFLLVDQLLTNFHLPRSTLLVLVSAFAGREHLLAAYRHAVEAGYRFYSYGDCMLIR
jgi:S-adenosylmethionine:tRNA ribosyltransferase-isomerase